MTTKFTPAPWKIADGDFIYALNDFKSNRFFFEIQAAGKGCAPPDEVVANANLIACAPEMYEMLEIALDCLGDEFALPRDIIDDIESILAKARGES